MLKLRLFTATPFEINQLENQAARAILEEAFERDKAGVVRRKAIKNNRFFSCR